MNYSILFWPILVLSMPILGMEPVSNKPQDKKKRDFNDTPMSLRCENETLSDSDSENTHNSTSSSRERRVTFKQTESGKVWAEVRTFKNDPEKHNTEDSLWRKRYAALKEFRKALAIESKEERTEEVNKALAKMKELGEDPSTFTKAGIKAQFDNLDNQENLQQ